MIQQIACSVVTFCVISLLFYAMAWGPYCDEYAFELRKHRLAEANIRLVCADKQKLSEFEGFDRCADDRAVLEQSLTGEAVRRLARTWGICASGPCVALNIITMVFVMVPLMLIIVGCAVAYGLWWVWTSQARAQMLPGPYMHPAGNPLAAFNSHTQHPDTQNILTKELRRQAAALAGNGPLYPPPSANDKAKTT